MINWKPIETMPHDRQVFLKTKTGAILKGKRLDNRYTGTFYIEHNHTYHMDYVERMCQSYNFEGWTDSIEDQTSYNWKPIEELDLVLLMEGKPMVLLNKKRPYVNTYGFICEDTYGEYGEDVHSLWDDMKANATHYAPLTPPEDK